MIHAVFPWISLLALSNHQFPERSLEVEILEGQGVWDRFIDHIAEPRQREVSDWAEERLIVDPIGS